MISTDPKLTPRQRVFLAAYETCFTVRSAAKAARIHRSTHYAWRRSSRAYREAFREAREIAFETLLGEARRRAVEGTQRKKFHEGLPVLDNDTNEQYVEQEFSDLLLIFLLKLYKPERFGRVGSIGPRLQVIPADNSVSIYPAPLLKENQV